MMNRVSKGLTALMMTGLLLGACGKAQAVIGVPDDVPASTLLFPFFKVDPDPTPEEGRQDTLIVVTNTANTNTFVHIVIWNTRSEHLFDFTVPLTPHDVFSCSLLDLLVSGSPEPCGPGTLPAPPSVQAGLQLSADGQIILAGYVTTDVVSGPTFLFPGQAGYPFLDENTLVGHMYLVNLPLGSASGFNAVSIESASPTLGHLAVARAGQFTGFYLPRCLEEQGTGAAGCAASVLPTTPTPLPPVPGRDLRERIDGPNGDIAQTGTASAFAAGGTANPGGADSPLGLILRYFSSPDIAASTELWLWKDRITPNLFLNVAVYDEEENAVSVQLREPLQFEVNFTPTAGIITPGVPGGWFRIKFPGPGTFNPASPTTPAATPIQAVAYAVQNANSTDITLRWDATFPAHRQYTNYIPSAAAE